MISKQYRFFTITALLASLTCQGNDNPFPGGNPSAGINPFDHTVCSIQPDRAAPYGKTFALPATGKHVTGKDLIPVDSEKTYAFSAAVRGAGPITFRVQQFDKNKGLIQAYDVNLVLNTDTQLLKDAARGSKTILVADASSWDFKLGNILAFGAKKDLSDLPNRNIEYYAVNKKKTEDGWEIELSRPLMQNHPAGDGIRLHRDGSNMIICGVKANETNTYRILPSESKAGAANRIWWVGTKFIKFQVFLPKGDQSVLIDNLELSPVNIESGTGAYQFTPSSGISPFETDSMIISDPAGKDGKTLRISAGKTVQGADLIPVDTKKSYSFTAIARGKSGKALFRLIQFDSQKHVINACNANPAVETLTRLVSAAKRGDKKIVVKDAYAWNCKLAPILAFGAKKDLSDLPNRNIEYYAVNKKKTEDGWEIELSRPLMQNHPAGDGIRLHRDGNHHVTGGISLDEKAVTMDAVIKTSNPGQFGGCWWTGTAYVKLLVTVSGQDPLLLDFIEIKPSDKEVFPKLVPSQASKVYLSTPQQVEFLSDSFRPAVSQSGLNIPAKDARQLEFKFKTETPGSIVVSCNQQENGKNVNANVRSYSVIPDGEFRTYAFPLDSVRQWNPESTLIGWQVQFISRSKGVLYLKDPVFRKETNILPDANQIASEGINVDDLMPDFEYLLEWRGDSDCPGMELTFQDHELKEIPGTKIKLAPGEKSLLFTAPSEVVRTVIHCGSTSEKGYPRLSLHKRKIAFGTEKYWRGQWICDREEGPFWANVWFAKDFTLDEVPDYAALAVMADDASSVYINGRLAGNTSVFYNPERFEITKYLKKGENRIAIRVYNEVAKYGLCCDVFIRTGKKEMEFSTDDSWKSHFSDQSKELPAEFNGPVIVLGPPATTAPWATRARFRFAGTRGILELLSAEPGKFTAKVVKVPPIDRIDIMNVQHVVDGRRAQIFKLPIEISGKMIPGNTVTVTYAQPTRHKDAYDLHLADDYLELAGDPSIASVPVAGKTDLQMARFINIGTRPQLQFGNRFLDPAFYHYPGATWFPAVPQKDILIPNYTISIQLTDFWRSEGQYDFTQLDTQVAQLLTVCPDAIFMLSIHAYMPGWWLQKNPDDTSASFSGEPPNTYENAQALGSKKWLHDAEGPLRALISHIKQQPWANRIWGTSIEESRNGEWFWGISAKREGKSAMSGFSLADHQSFRTMLREKYKDEEALRKAWKQPDVTFENAKMPDPALAVNKGKGALFNPETDAQLQDWFVFRNEVLADALLHFARLIKKETDGKWLCGAYYGYVMEMADNNTRPQTHHGHNGFYRVAESPDIDFLRGPNRYRYRGTGLPGGFMQPVTTFARHGKLIYLENDNRSSYNYTGDTYCGAPSGNVETIGQFNRDFGIAVTMGHAPYWYDDTCHSFHKKPLTAVLRKQFEICKALPLVKGLTPVETAIVSDRDSCYYAAPIPDSTIFTAVSAVFRNINNLGVPFDLIVVQDLFKKDMIPARKLYIMLPTLVLDKDQRAQLKARFEREKATVLWLYGAGSFYPGHAASGNSCGDFFDLKCEMVSQNIWDRLFYQSRTGKKEYDSTYFMSPRFYPVAGFDEVLGRNRQNKPLVVVKKLNGATHIFSTLPDLPLEMLDMIREKAGVFSYTENGYDPLWIGNDLLFLIAKKGGTKKINLPLGTRMKALIGPLSGTFESGESWQAEPGMTYGFLIEKK